MVALVLPAELRVDMPSMTFGRLQIDPALNPAVLDTATWQPEAVVAALTAATVAAWNRVRRQAQSGAVPSGVGHFTFGVPGPLPAAAGTWAVARLEDGQQALLLFRRGPAPAGLALPLASRSLAEGWTLDLLPADLESVAAFVRWVAPERGPQALGPVPRLGIGTRMSTAVWPGLWEAVRRRPLAANAIQNSVRELNLLSDLTSGVAPRVNYLFGFGRLEEGHTGSTFEGLWLAGVLSALQAGGAPRYGADADHIMVKRSADGLERAKAVVAAARHYTFFTLDVSDVLDYAAGRTTGAAEAHWLFEATVPEAAQRRELVAYHGEARAELPALSAASVGRGAAKFWRALAAVEALAAEVRRLRGTAPFDLELSIDEVPAGIPVADVLTSADEVAFLVGEVRRRALPVTHLAPNLGVEKGTDYRLAGGLPGLEARTRELHQLLHAAGLTLDCHSGDDLGAATRQAIGRATGGQVHFKISPSLQILFAHVLQDEAPEVFRFWWDDTLAYARQEAEAGSPLAARLVVEAASALPSPRHPLFHLFSFASVGRRSPGGEFLNRARFYSLPPAFQQAYTERVTAFLLEVAADLYGEC
jgi:hypothetical protein